MINELRTCLTFKNKNIPAKDLQKILIRSPNLKILKFAFHAHEENYKIFNNLSPYHIVLSSLQCLDLQSVKKINDNSFQNILQCCRKD